jgi:hypothetical protein
MWHLAVPIGGDRPTRLDKRAHVNGIVLADDNVFTARTQCISRFHMNHVMARAAHDLQPADHTPAMQIAVVQLILLDNIVLETVQVFFGEQLARKETRTAQAFETAAFGARRQR